MLANRLTKVTSLPTSPSVVGSSVVRDTSTGISIEVPSGVVSTDLIVLINYCFNINRTLSSNLTSSIFIQDTDFGTINVHIGKEKVGGETIGATLSESGNSISFLVAFRGATGYVNLGSFFSISGSSISTTISTNGNSNLCAVFFSESNASLVTSPEGMTLTNVINGTSSEGHIFNQVLNAMAITSVAKSVTYADIEPLSAFCFEVR